MRLRINCQYYTIVQVDGMATSGALCLPLLKKDMVKVNMVQKRATKMIVGLE